MKKKINKIKQAIKSNLPFQVRKQVDLLEKEITKEILEKIGLFILEEVRLNEDRLIDYALIVDYLHKLNPKRQ